MDWNQKLAQLGVPYELASRMALDLQTNLPYSPDQFTSLQQLDESIRSHGLQSLDWYSDLMDFLNQLMQTLLEIAPGIIVTAVGGAILYFLRNVKIKNIPIGLVGLAPLGYGMWMILQPFLQQQTS